MSGVLCWLRRRFGAVAVALSSFALGGCFFYDSSWGQAKASQKRVAAARMPATLGTDNTGTRLVRAPGDNASVTRLKLRAYATPHYAAALVDGEAQFAQALSDANPELARGLSLHIDLVDYRVWTSGEADDDLSALLSTLEKEDAATDVDWVVVLASPRNMVASGPDQLGVGQLLGRHIAIRAMSDAAEFDAIEQGYTELSEDEKHKLYAAGKRHKAATVLLHEIGHTLGMPHELAQHSLMSPRYDPQSAMFSAPAARIGQHALELRATSAGTELHRQSAQAALNVLSNAPAHTFEEKTAAEVRQLLEFHARAPLTAAPSTAGALAQPSRVDLKPAAPAAPGMLSQLTTPDRALFARARQEQTAGHFAEARSLAKPLFETYPDSYAVQELRCQLAMKAHLPIAEEQSECAPLMRLSGSPL
jgi:hypothetical protein